ncbi:T9SS type A sorting domain-containing protein [bacterium]|nr:T9SS type A sorting domain-containing protein [bacterium]
MRSAVLVLALAAGILITPLAWAGTPTSSFDSKLPSTLERIPAVGPTFRAVATPDSLLSALLTGTDYIQAMQADITDDNAGNGVDGAGETPDDPDDGGWDWSVASPPDPVSHTTGASPKNLYGVTAQSLYHAYLTTGDAGYLTAMTDAANAMIVDPGVRSASDITFLLDFNALPAVSGTAYQDSAKAKYDGRIATYTSADSLAKYIRDVRAGQGYENGIIPWDIGAWALAAAKLDERFGGYASDADDIAEVIWQDTFNASPGYFDLVADSGFDSTYANTDYYWYTLGVSGLITGFVASDTHTSELPALVTRLTDSQYASGAISGSYGANTGDEDWQGTAYSAMALALYDHASYAAEIGEMGTWIAATQDTLTGGWRYSSNSHYPEIAGENICGLFAAYLAANSVDPDGTGLCLSTVDLCATVPVYLTRSESNMARGASVTIQLSPELELCGSITQGTWITSGFGTPVYHVVDNGGGSYTVDQSILGGACGTTTGGHLFDVPVQKTAGVTTDSTGTVTVTSVAVRDCANHALPGIPGGAAAVTIDLTPATAVADLSATQKKTGNDGDGTTKVVVNFTAPVDADSVMVFRKGYGDYPEYDDGSGTVPAVPTSPANALGNGWALTSVTADGQEDDPGTTRDFWYYVVFTEDGCNNVSAASNMTGGVLNYHLGDVSNGGTPGQGNNVVTGVDLSLLGSFYGAFADSVNYLDVGPTTDFSADARPVTDNLIGFEDLMMFAINHGAVSRIGADGIVEVPSDHERPVLDLIVERGQEITARLVLRNHEAAVKGIHAVLTFDSDAMEFAGMAQGDLLHEQGAPLFVKSLEGEGSLVFDAAALGTDRVLTGSGEVAVLTFREKKPGAALALSVADLRGNDNRPLGDTPVVDGPAVVSPALPTELALLGARPNPFAHSTDIVFRLPESRLVRVDVYDVSGRLVRQLTERTMPAGEHRVSWDGRTRNGSVAGAGIYFYTFRAGDHRETRKILHVR